MQEIELVSKLWSVAGSDGHRVTLNNEGGKAEYFTPSGYISRSTRKAENVRAIGSFWLDLDCGEGKPYADKATAGVALMEWLDVHKFPAFSYLVDSGNGLHVYWLLDRGVPPDEWKPVAERFKQATKATGLHADPSRTADPASLMRVPGSLNLKDPANPKPVQVLLDTGRKVTFEEFSSSIPVVGPRHAVPRPHVASPLGDFDSTRPPSDPVKATERCAQLRWVREETANGGYVPEPLWRAALSVWVRCEGGEEVIHEWSRGDARYTRGETQRKAEGTTGPATCAFFQDHAPDRCKGCPLSNKPAGYSPIMAGEIVPEEKVIEALPTSLWELDGFGKYSLSMQGVRWSGDANNEPEQVSCIPIWVDHKLDPIDGSSLTHHVLICWIREDGRHDSLLLPEGMLQKDKEFPSIMGNKGVTGVVSNWKRLMTYLSQYTRELVKKRQTRTVYEHLGWQADGAFVLGNRRVSKDGAIEESVVNRRVSPHLEILEKQGELSSWKEAVAVLGAPGYEALAFALLAGFGSPILGLVGKQGAVLSLAGNSGAGKTLSASAALSIYGSPKDLTQSAGAGSTTTAIELRLSMLHNLPYLLDEVTVLQDHKVGDYLYLMANGQGKSAANRNREERSVGTWSMVPIVTSNKPISDIAERYLNEAQSRRMLEFIITEPMPHADGMKLVKVADNYGHAAEVFLPAVAKMKEDVIALFYGYEEKLRKHEGIKDADRFAIWLCAAAWTGGYLARSIGLIDMDVEAVIAHAVERLTHTSQEATKLNAEEQAPVVIAEWLNANNHRITHWPIGTRFAEDGGQLVKDPVARVTGDGYVLVAIPEVKAALLERGIGWSLMRNWLARNSNPQLGKAPVRLFPGSPTVRVVALRADAIGMGDEK